MARLNQKSFKNLIKTLALEIKKEEELDEITTTGDADGYGTPFAFSKDKKSRLKKLKKGLGAIGYSIAEGSLTEAPEKKRKPGDTWKSSGAKKPFKAMNQDGSIQGYTSQKAADKWAQGSKGGDGEEPKGDTEKDKDGDYTEKPDSKKDDTSDDTTSDDTKDDTGESDEEEFERKEKEELEKKATRGFFQSKWDDFQDKGIASLAKGAMAAGEKKGDEMEKGETPISDPLSVGKDIEQHKKGQAAAQKTLKKKDIASKKKADAQVAKDAKEMEKKNKDKEKKASKPKSKPKVKKKKKVDKKIKTKKVTKKRKKEEMIYTKKNLTEALEASDIKKIKAIVRDVVADILRDLWIKRSVWKK